MKMLEQRAKITALTAVGSKAAVHHRYLGNHRLEKLNVNLYLDHSLYFYSYSPVVSIFGVSSIKSGFSSCKYCLGNIHRRCNPLLSFSRYCILNRAFAELGNCHAQARNKPCSKSNGMEDHSERDQNLQQQVSQYFSVFECIYKACEDMDSNKTIVPTIAAEAIGSSLRLKEHLANSDENAQLRFSKESVPYLSDKFLKKSSHSKDSSISAAAQKKNHGILSEGTLVQSAAGGEIYYSELGQSRMNANRLFKASPVVVLQVIKDLGRSSVVTPEAWKEPLLLLLTYLPSLSSSELRQALVLLSDCMCRPPIVLQGLCEAGLWRSFRKQLKVEDAIGILDALRKLRYRPSSRHVNSIIDAIQLSKKTLNVGDMLKILRFFVRHHVIELNISTESLRGRDFIQSLLPTIERSTLELSLNQAATLGRLLAKRGLLDQSWAKLLTDACCMRLFAGETEELCFSPNESSSDSSPPVSSHHKRVKMLPFRPFLYLGQSFRVAQINEVPQAYKQALSNLVERHYLSLEAADIAEILALLRQFSLRDTSALNKIGIAVQMKIHLFTSNQIGVILCDFIALQYCHRSLFAALSQEVLQAKQMSSILAPSASSLSVSRYPHRTGSASDVDLLPEESFRNNTSFRQLCPASVHHCGGELQRLPRGVHIPGPQFSDTSPSSANPLLSSLSREMCCYTQNDIFSGAKSVISENNDRADPGEHEGSAALSRNQEFVDMRDGELSNSLFETCDHFSVFKNGCVSRESGNWTSSTVPLRKTALLGRGIDFENVQILFCRKIDSIVAAAMITAASVMKQRNPVLLSALLASIHRAIIDVSGEVFNNLSTNKCLLPVQPLFMMMDDKSVQLKMPIMNLTGNNEGGDMPNYPKNEPLPSSTCKPLHFFHDTEQPHVFQKGHKLLSQCSYSQRKMVCKDEIRTFLKVQGRSCQKMITEQSEAENNAFASQNAVLLKHLDRQNIHRGKGNQRAGVKVVLKSARSENMVQELSSKSNKSEYDATPTTSPSLRVRHENENRGSAAPFVDSSQQLTRKRGPIFFPYTRTFFEQLQEGSFLKPEDWAILPWHYWIIQGRMKTSDHQVRAGHLLRLFGNRGPVNLLRQKRRRIFYLGCALMYRRRCAGRALQHEGCVVIGKENDLPSADNKAQSTQHVTCDFVTSHRHRLNYDVSWSPRSGIWRMTKGGESIRDSMKRWQRLRRAFLFPYQEIALKYLNREIIKDKNESKYFENHESVNHSNDNLVISGENLVEKSLCHFREGIKVKETSCERTSLLFTGEHRGHLVLPGGVEFYNSGNVPLLLDTGLLIEPLLQENCSPSLRRQVTRRCTIMQQAAFGVRRELDCKSSIQQREGQLGILVGNAATSNKRGVNRVKDRTSLRSSFDSLGMSKYSPIFESINCSLLRKLKNDTFGLRRTAAALDAASSLRILCLATVVPMIKAVHASVYTQAVEASKISFKDRTVCLLHPNNLQELLLDFRALTVCARSALETLGVPSSGYYLKDRVFRNIDPKIKPGLQRLRYELLVSLDWIFSIKYIPLWLVAARQIDSVYPCADGLGKFEHDYTVVVQALLQPSILSILITAADLYSMVLMALIECTYKHACKERLLHGVIPKSCLNDASRHLQSCVMLSKWAETVCSHLPAAINTLEAFPPYNWLDSLANKINDTYNIKVNKNVAIQAKDVNLSSLSRLLNACRRLETSACAAALCLGTTEAECLFHSTQQTFSDVRYELSKHIEKYLLLHNRSTQMARISALVPAVVALALNSHFSICIDSQMPNDILKVYEACTIKHLFNDQDLDKNHLNYDSVLHICGEFKLPKKKVMKLMENQLLMERLEI